ncbi:methyltransferase domain-containing protein [Candidatus Saccharibacteria bacterium]|nr:methyltransferase domain-containing protein [Candidatus Saccharibacteria bacterium]
MKYLAILGRQPKISLAELESIFGAAEQIGDSLAVFESNDAPDINRFGSVLKFAEQLDVSPLDFLSSKDGGKIVFGISDYSHGANTYKTNNEALKLKKILARHGIKSRALQNKAAVLSTATSHHNQLSEKTNHFELIKVDKTWWNVIGVQNITSYAKRDQVRPARDAKVGMLPPKLAQILINLCGNLSEKSVVLDPFCGTGVVLQEALLMGYTPYGTDLSERMVEYSKKNLNWIATEKNLTNQSTYAKMKLCVGDARDFDWSEKIDAVACETYLGSPMSKPPVEIKLKEEKQGCSAIILGFLKNLAKQVKSGTPVVIAVPAWLRENGSYSRLNMLDEIEKLGYNLIRFKNVSQKDLIYHREGQIVAREIIVLRKK